MQFEEGNAGKPRGSKNKTTVRLREKLNSWLADNFEGLETDIKLLRPKDRVDFYIKLLSFGLPTLKAVEYTAEIKNKIDDMTDEQLEQLVDTILNNDETEEGGNNSRYISER